MFSPARAAAFAVAALAIGLTPAARAEVKIGPNCHRIMEATSADGYAFSATDRTVLSAASAPDAAVLADGTLRLYYVNGDYEDHGIWAADIASDGGVEVKGKVTLDGAFVGDAVAPDAVVEPDGSVRLYYFESFVTRPERLQGNLMKPILVAKGADGQALTVERKIFDVRRGSDPSVVRLADGSYVMALAQKPDGMILIGTSPDGSTFTLSGRIEGGVPDLVALDDGRVRLFFRDRKGFGSYVSADGGNTWEREPGLRMEASRSEDDPSVVELADGTWRMYYRVDIPGCVTNHSKYIKGGAGGSQVVLPRRMFENFTWEAFVDPPAELETCLTRQLTAEEMTELRKGKEPWEQRLRHKAQAIYKFCTRQLDR